MFVSCLGVLCLAVRGDTCGDGHVQAAWEECDGDLGCDATTCRRRPGFDGACDAGAVWPGAVLTPRRPLREDGGVFCAARCAAFPTPPGLGMTPACRLANIDECAAGTHGCDAHATCTDVDVLAVPGNASVPGFSCRCSDLVFPVAPGGITCSTSGVELDFTCAAETPPAACAAAATGLPACLAAAAVTRAGAPPVADIAVDGLAVHVRIAMHHVNMSVVWWDVGARLEACLGVNVSREDVCGNDATQPCTSCATTCRYAWPAVRVTVVENSLDHSVVDVASFGYALTSTSFRGLEWRLELTYDPAAFARDGDMPFVFLSRTATVDGFDTPCALGALNTAGCCVAALPGRVVLTTEFAADVAAVLAEGNGTCPAPLWQHRWGNASARVAGALANLSTASYAATTAARPGRVLVRLVYADVVAVVGRRTQDAQDEPEAEHLHFFLGIGAARIRGAALVVSAPPVHLYSKITPQYYFTSRVRTIDTFSPALFVQLVRVFDAAAGVYHDLVHLTLQLPGTQAFDTTHGDLLPLLSTRAGIGYTPEGSALGEFYPCVERPDAAAYALLTGCTHELPLCTTVLSADGAVNVLFPLGIGFFDNMMAAYDQWNVIPLNLYLDFVLRVRAGDEFTFSRFYTATRVRRENMQQKCTARALGTSLASLVDVSTLHGLAENATQARARASGLDATAAAFDPIANAANFDTIVLAGNASFFEGPGHESHGVDLEAVLTLFFLSTVKKDYVLELMGRGEAFAYDAATGREMPTPVLLEVCPLSRVSRTQGCLGMWQVRDRVLDVEQHSAFGVVPFQSSFVNETRGDNAGRDWLAARPWARHAAFEQDLVSDHIAAVGAAFAVNSRFSRAFVFASDIPLLGGNATAPEYVQFYLRVCTVRIDLRAGAARVQPRARVVVVVPALEPVWEFGVNQGAHDAIASAFARVLGVRLHEVRVPLANITNATFGIVLDLPWTGASTAAHTRLARALAAPGSGLRQRLAAALRRALRGLVAEPAVGLLGAGAPWAATVDASAAAGVGRRLLAEAPASADTPAQNYTTATRLTELRGVQNGDQLMAFLETSNISAPLLAAARVAAIVTESPGIDPCTMDEDAMRATLEADVGPALVAASRDTVSDVAIANVVVRNKAEFACAPIAPVRRLLQTPTATVDAEIVLIPTPRVAQDLSLTIFVEATPALLSLGMRSFVPETSVRTNASIVFLGEGIRGDGSLFALTTEPVETTTPTPTLTPTPTPTPAPDNNVDALRALLASTALASIVTACLVVSAGVGLVPTPAAPGLFG